MAQQDRQTQPRVTAREAQRALEQRQAQFAAREQERAQQNAAEEAGDGTGGV